MGRRARREWETPDFIKAVARMIGAAGKRAADADEIELRMLIELHDAVESAVQEAVDGQRARGVSWAGIARATGTTREGAFARYGRKKAA